VNFSSLLSLPPHRQAVLGVWPLAFLLGLAGCQTTAPEATPVTASAATAMAPEIPGLAAYDYATSLDPLKALDVAVANAGKDPVKVTALVGRLTETLRAPATTFAARQAICERLGHLLMDASGGAVTASHSSLAVLAPWLEDAKLAPLALLALERVPGPAIDQLIQKAASRADGPTRQAIEGCLSRRQVTARAAAPATESVSALVADLGAANFAKKERALQQLGQLPAGAVSAAVADQLASWDAETQRSALTLIARLGHKAAVAAVVSATKHTDSSVRLAALTTLGRLPGTPAVAQRLLDVAAGTSSEETKAALASLGQLNGPGINELLLAGARKGAAPARVLCLRALAARYTLEAMPLAYQLRKDSETTVRSAALDLLADIAPITEQAAVLEWTWQQTDEDDLTRAQRALIAITQRAAKPAEGVRVVLAALEKADPAVQLRQLRLLPRLGDADSLACAQRLAASSDAAVAAAAKTAVARWPKPKEEKK
jgi:HEAT repeat protein